MKVLIAEDDAVTRHLLNKTLGGAGMEVVQSRDGNSAWEILAGSSGEAPPRLVVLDWMMPGLDGIELCRRIRERTRGGYTYIILLTAKSHQEDINTGLDAGADDFIVKPFDRTELLCRVRAGQRILDLETRLEDKVVNLTAALEHVKQLQGLLPICMQCKSIRDGEDMWQRIETYIESRTDASFTHSICERCMSVHYGRGSR